MISSEKTTGEILSKMLNQSLTVPSSEQKLFWLFVITIIVSVGASFAMESPLPLMLPIATVFLLFTLNSVNNLYYLFFFLLPFSIEVSLPGGFGTDIPSEPLMLVLMSIGLVLYVVRIGSVSIKYFTHPISLIVLLHVIWIAFSCIFSVDHFVSFKFLIAKSWYLIPFYFLPFILFKKENDIKRVFLFLLLGLFISIFYVMFRHSLEGFSFHSINKAVRPIYRNHVSYGIILVCALPYLWYLIKTSTIKSSYIKALPFVIILAAIYLTYTRAAQLSVVLAIGVYWVIRWRLVKISLALSLAFLIGGSTWLAYNNKYLDFAPNYEKTITHYKFDNLVEATYKMEDISTVERFYRWVAGFYMVKERPITGFGPSTFYSQYKAHTVSSYKTYVSNNPEKSGIHNNYLMVAVEQGIPGLIIMLILAFFPLIYAEKVYHALKKTSEKQLVMAAAICFAVIDIVILINDLLEADKVGPLYFLSAAIIVFYAVKVDKERGGVSEVNY